jgi:predicted RNA binding protein YcfA (HicA-like mRNA interferase family)
MKSSQLLKLLKQDGWYVENQEGSHMLMRHPTKPGKLSFPFHASKEVKPGLLHAILKQANIKTNKR